MFGLNNIALAGLGALAVVGWLNWYFLNAAHTRLIAESATKIERAESNAAKARQALLDQRATVERLKLQAGRLRANLDAENDKRAELIKERDAAYAKYDAYRSRLPGLMAAKGSLIARLANRATRVRVGQITATTCRTGCSKGQADTAKADTGEEAGRNKPTGP